MRALIVKAILAASLAVLPAAALAAEFVLVAHPSVAATAVSRAEVSRMFLRLQTAWPEGGHARPVDQAKSSPVRDAFTREVHGKSVTAIDRYWTEAIFSGRAVPPVEKRSDADVLAYVRENPGAIGYVSASAPTEGVKRLALKD
jgi:ABC-type phosphate transport system substrate-binding protein